MDRDRVFVEAYRTARLCRALFLLYGVAFIVSVCLALMMTWLTESTPVYLALMATAVACGWASYGSLMNAHRAATLCEEAMALS